MITGIKVIACLHNIQSIYLLQSYKLNNKFLIENKN